jgi:hypothetical protein
MASQRHQIPQFLLLAAFVNIKKIHQYEVECMPAIDECKIDFRLFAELRQCSMKMIIEFDRCSAPSSAKIE